MLKHQDRKLLILHQLEQAAEPATLTELVGWLEFDCTDRTVRRLLTELISEGVVQKIGSTKGVRYAAVKVSNNARPKRQLPTKERHLLHAPGWIDTYFSSDSLIAIEKITKPLFERQPITYNIDWVNSYEPNISSYLSATLKEQLQKAGKRSNEDDPAGTYAHKIFNRLLIDLSYNSSRLEGNTYSLLDTERLVLHGDSAEGKLDEEKTMILNHKDAIRYLVDNASRFNVSKNVICTLHYLLSDGLIEPQYAGKVRDYAVRIGGSTYIPFEDRKRLQLHLEEISEKAAAILDPFEQSLFLLIHISYLQAFVDVNKRTARLSANISLITKNLVPLAFSDVKTQDYMSAMIAIYELQDVNPLVDLYVYSYMRTCLAYDSTIKALGFDEVRVRYRLQRRALIREVILQKMTDSKAQPYIKEELEKVIPKEDWKAFEENVIEDLIQIDHSRIAGLGVTPLQLDDWLLLFRKV